HAAEQPLFFLILSDHVLDRTAYPCPVPFEEGVVRRIGVFTISSQDYTQLTVVGDMSGRFAAVPDFAILFEREAVVDHLTRHALELGKNPRASLRVVPHVSTCPRAAVDSLPRPEPAVVEPEAGLCREVAEGNESAIEEPVG